MAVEGEQGEGYQYWIRLWENGNEGYHRSLDLASEFDRNKRLLAKLIFVLAASGFEIPDKELMDELNNL